MCYVPDRTGADVVLCADFGFTTVADVPIQLEMMIDSTEPGICEE